jgi:small-conductance mechanosensitive channel
MERLTIASDLRHAIDQQFREEGIVIPFPQQVVHFQRKAERPRNEEQNSSHGAIEQSPKSGHLQ